MDYLVLSINYVPEPTGFAPHVAAICEYLAGNDNTVHVITGFPFAPTWKRWDSFRGKWQLTHEVNGVTVHRLTHFIPRRPSRFIERVLMEGSFCLHALWHIALFHLTPFDLIVYVGAQPSIAYLARLLSRLWNIPYVVEINDLAAQAASDVRIVKSQFVNSWMMRFEYWSYRASSGAVVLCPAFADALIARGYPQSNIRLIRSPINLERIKPVPADGKFRKMLNVRDDDFLILYAGSMGLKQGLLNVVEAARLAHASRQDIKWVLVGDGEARNEIRKRIVESALENFVFLLPFQDEADMAKMFADSDLLLLNQVASVKDTVIPSKLLTYMASGKAVLAAVNVEGQGADLLRESGGGIIVQPEHPPAIVHAIEYLARDDESLRTMGRLNRNYAEGHFDQRKILQQHASFLDEVLQLKKRFKGAKH